MTLRPDDPIKWRSDKSELLKESAISKERKKDGGHDDKNNKKDGSHCMSEEESPNEASNRR